VKVCVLFNPKAGSAAPIDALRELLQARPGVVVRESRDADDLARLAREAAAGRFDVIAVAGGDGTVHAVVEALGPRFPRANLLVLPLGTGNDLCRTLAVPLDPLEAVKLLDTGAARKVDVIRVGGDATGFAINAVTGGFSGRVAADVTPELKASWGPLAYLRGAAGPIAERAGYKVRLRLDGGKPIHLDVLNLVVANGRTAAGGIPVAPLASVEDGKLDVVIVPSADFAELSVVAARVMAGDYDQDETVIHRRAKVVEVESDPSLPVSIDGELTEGRHFTFTALRRAVRVLTGPDYVKAPRPASDDGPPPSARSRLFGLVAAVLRLSARLPKVYVFGLAAAVVTLLVFAWLARGVLADEWTDANRSATGSIQSADAPAVRAAAEAVTELGGAVGMAVMTAGVVLTYLARRRYLDAATVLAAVLGAILLEAMFKPWFQVERPTPLDGGWTEYGVYSFPSGHALRTVALYGCLAALIVSRQPRSVWRWLVGAGLVLLAVAVCWSRVYLGVHWLTDVIAGALASAFWVTACLLARHWASARFAARRLRRHPPTG
jgi:diacylglycerol kinase (ATP)